MSVQFGRWQVDGQPADPGYLQKAKEMLAPYAPDGEGAYIKDGVGILYRAFHTTKESRNESQPFVTPSGSVLCWDGRLDNREELLRELGEPLTASATDIDIVAAAYEATGTACFAKLTGDWALSVWEPKTRSVVLAKDPIGTRHLYYSFDKDQITWSTILDPLVLLAGKSFALEEEYIAGWLSFFPASHLTPYVGIHSVPPSCFVRLVPGRRMVIKYWDFDPQRRIRCGTDGEYEEHFRAIFAEAVRRRLRSDCPILAELSGGMDSSSIVCMADTIMARAAAETPRLDTISYYDDSEPNWNERPYFTKVEEMRGRTGCHIDTRSQAACLCDLRCKQFGAIPGSNSHPSEAAKLLAACMASQGSRVVLSGIGGDEITGGVPTPVPEIADLLAEARFRQLAHQLKLWALDKRKPWIHLLLECVREFFPPALVGLPEHLKPAPWMRSEFIRRNRTALTGYASRLKLLGALPSFQENVATLGVLQRQLESSALPLDPPHEKRYPYLDRDLLGFLFAIPREQLVRPGQRRSLMRRALRGIVPEEILTRKRKAFLARAPLAAIRAEGSSAEGIRLAVLISLGTVNASAFEAALEEARKGMGDRVVTLIRSLWIESWLRSLLDQGVLGNPAPLAASRAWLPDHAGSRRQPAAFEKFGS